MLVPSLQIAGAAEVEATKILAGVVVSGPSPQAWMAEEGETNCRMMAAVALQAPTNQAVLAVETKCPAAATTLQVAVLEA